MIYNSRANIRLFLCPVFRSDRRFLNSIIDNLQSASLFIQENLIFNLELWCYEKELENAKEPQGVVQEKG